MTVYESMTPEQRTARARKAAAASWAATKDKTARTAAGRKVAESRFSSPEEKSAYFRVLAAKSAAVRRAMREAK